MKMLLKGKLKEANDTLERFTTVLSNIETTTQIFQENNLTDIKENVDFVNTKMKTYKSQLQDLKNSVPPEEIDGKENMNHAQERLASIFQQVWMISIKFILNVQFNLRYIYPIQCE